MTLCLREPFRTSQFQGVESESVIIRLDCEGGSGMGEAKTTADACGGRMTPVAGVMPQVERLLGSDPFNLEEILACVKAEIGGASCLLAGLDMALHDLCGKLLGIPVYRWLGLNPGRTPLNSYTIGLDALPVMIEKTRAARNFPVLKIKVGVPGDVEMVHAIRQETDAVLRVDANGGWSSVKEAVDAINGMADCGIELVEQPLPRGHLRELRQVRENVDIPLFADEDARTVRDIPALAGGIDGVNIKLMECGGIREALRMIHVARALGMKVMLGCMVESSLSLTAAAHLTPLADYADLDANLLLRNDPFKGFESNRGVITLPRGPGLGVTARG